MPKQILSTGALQIKRFSENERRQVLTQNNILFNISIKYIQVLDTDKVTHNLRIEV